MKTAGSLLILMFVVCACSKEVERNLDDWKGTWKIATLKEGNTSGMHDFMSVPWKDGIYVHENYGSMVIDENGGATLTFRNDDFSDSLASFTFEGYLHDYGSSHLEFYGVKVTASENANKAVGAELGNDGKLVFWMRDNDGKERFAEMDGLGYYGIMPANDVRWLQFTKQ